MQTLEDYIKLVLPIIRFCSENKSTNRFRGNHIWYLYRQIYYGFSETVGSEFVCYCSESALEVYDHLKGKEITGKALRDLKWKEQPKVDPGRKELILEHMYTGDEFRNDVYESLAANELNVDSVSELIRKNYSVCWITRMENKKLPKSKRPEGPIATYNAVGIKLVG